MLVAVHINKSGDVVSRETSQLPQHRLGIRRRDRAHRERILYHVFGNNLFVGRRTLWSLAFSSVGAAPMNDHNASVFCLRLSWPAAPRRHSEAHQAHDRTRHIQVSRSHRLTRLTLIFMILVTKKNCTSVCLYKYDYEFWLLNFYLSVWFICSSISFLSLSLSFLRFADHLRLCVGSGENREYCNCRVSVCPPKNR